MIPTNRQVTCSTFDNIQICLLVYLLHDENKSVRQATAYTLGKIGMSAIPALLNALTCKNWIVRFRSVEALGMMNDTRVLNILISALDDEKDHVRYVAAKYLGKLRDDRAVKVLIKKLKDENAFVRKGVATALGLIGGSISHSALQNALTQEQLSMVRDAINNSLLNLRHDNK